MAHNFDELQGIVVEIEPETSGVANPLSGVICTVLPSKLHEAVQLMETIRAMLSAENPLFNAPFSEKERSAVIASLTRVYHRALQSSEITHPSAAMLLEELEKCHPEQQRLLLLVQYIK